jgi:hypothetical protein
VVIVASAAYSTVVESSFMLVPILVGLVESSGPAYRDADCAVGGFDAIDLDVSRRLQQV